MVAFSRIALGLAAAAVSLAAPTAEVDERGPMNFSLGFDHPLSRRFGNFTVRSVDPRSNTNYVQDYKTGGTVNFTPGTNDFTLNWNTEQDFVVGVGWNPGGTAYVFPLVPPPPLWAAISDHMLVPSRTLVASASPAAWAA